MRFEDMDAVTLARRALIMADIVESCEGWFYAAKSALYLLIGIAMGSAIADLYYRRPLGPVLLANLVCFLCIFAFGETQRFMIRRTLRLMQLYIERRNEVLTWRPPKPPASGDGTGGG